MAVSSLFFSLLVKGCAEFLRDKGLDSNEDQLMAPSAALYCCFSRQIVFISLGRRSKMLKLEPPRVKI